MFSCRCGFREIMAIYASWSRNMLIAMKFTRVDRPKEAYYFYVIEEKS
jgi:hypothetical protein